MIQINLNTFLAKKIEERCGASQKKWEGYFSALAGYKVQIPYFFWEIEMPLKTSRIPASISLKFPAMNGWLQVIFEKNLKSEFERHIKSKMFGLNKPLK
ncbi:MAG: hypothetical protein OEZ13_03130 [Spirochaetia bacterium]|nr:hypothetical protein [Spirochaetia bacterium]